MRRVDVAAGTLNAALREFPPGLDAVRVLAPRYPGAGVIIPRVDLDVPGDGAARKATSGLDLDLCSLCASVVGSTILSNLFSGAMGRDVSAESRCVTSPTGTNWPASMLSRTCAASLSNDCGAAVGCIFEK